MTEYESYTDPCPSRCMQYFSGREVLAAADHSAARGRLDHYFYPCGRCGYWHLMQQTPLIGGGLWGNFRFRDQEKTSRALDSDKSTRQPPQ